MGFKKTRMHDFSKIGKFYKMENKMPEKLYKPLIFALI